MEGQEQCLFSALQVRTIARSSNVSPSSMLSVKLDFLGLSRLSWQSLLAMCHGLGYEAKTDRQETKAIRSAHTLEFESCKSRDEAA